RGDVQEALDEDRTVAVTWLPWRSLPPAGSLGPLDPSAPLVVAHALTHYLFACSVTKEVICFEYVPGSGWRSPISLGGEVTGLAAATHLDNTVEVFARRAADDEIVSRRQVAPGRW
ncbi:MAG TPA: hypothetical protein VNX21_09140, partial [Candidatus Thermoplasmatota archaeon]|nr:hypothetical protein [Candidatus Thermoplasmatota archaeon]